MKAVAFVCLLTLSVRLSQATSVADPQKPQTLNTTADTSPKVEGNPQVLSNGTPGTPEKQATPATHTIADNNTLNTTVTPNPNEKGTDSGYPKLNEATGAAAKDNKTGPIPEAPSKQTDTPAVAPKTEGDGKDKPSHETTTGDKDKKVDPPAESGKDKKVDPPAESGKDKKVDPPAVKNSTTVPPATAAPKNNETTEKPLVAARGFDGASFVGGIILTLGLLAIGFMGFKYYKNQTERNYHTL